MKVTAIDIYVETKLTSPDEVKQALQRGRPGCFFYIGAVKEDILKDAPVNTFRAQLVFEHTTDDTLDGVIERIVQDPEILSWYEPDDTFSSTSFQTTAAAVASSLR